MFEELSLHILDIAMNSLAAGATRVDIAVIENAKHDWLIIRVRDNGHGMDGPTLQQVLSWNFSSKRLRKKSIGLGIALLRQTSEMCGGTFHLRSQRGRGTSVTASMRLSHVDRPPLGDLEATILTLCAAGPGVDVRLDYRSDGQTFHFSSQEPDSGERSTHEPRRTQTAQGKGAAASRAA